MEFKIFILFCLLCFSVGVASATVSYTPPGTYAADYYYNNNIYISGDHGKDLAWLETQLNNQSLLRHSGSTYYLNSTIQLADGATLYINNSYCSQLVLSNQVNGIRSGTGGITRGSLYLENTSVKSWDYNTSSIPDAFVAPSSHLFEIDIDSPGRISDCNLEGVKRVLLTSVSGISINNMYINNSQGHFGLQNCAYINVNNITNTNSSAGRPLWANGGHDIHVTNLTSFRTGGGGVTMSCSNSTMQNINVNDTGWMGVEYDSGANNCSIINATVRNAGHNGMDIHGASNLYVENLSVYDSESNNIILTASGSPTNELYNISLNNITTFYSAQNLYSDGILLSSLGTGYPTAENITITNWISDGDHQCLETSGVNNLTITNLTAKNNTYGIMCASYGTNASIIDSDIYNCTGNSLYLITKGVVNLINTKYSNPYIYQTGNQYSVYYYPNLNVLDSLSNGIENAQITANTTVKNGYGKNQTFSLTDSNGKLYDLGNGSNWIALPEKHVDYSGTTTYNSLITASKSGHSNSTVVAPSSKWYSPNPASLQGTKIVLSIDVDSGGSPPVDQSSIVEFFPESTALTKNTGESVTFNVNYSQLLTTNWLINGKLVQSNATTMTKSWNTSGTYNVTFSGYAIGNAVLHSWFVDVIDSSKTQNESIVTITPEYQVVSPGKQFGVNITVEPGTAITGAQSGLLFQGSMANVNRISEGNLFSESGAKTYFSNGTVDSSVGLNRYIYCSALGNSSVSSPGILATINLTAGSSIGIAKFNLSNVTISDSNSSPVPNTIKNASLLIDTAPVFDLIGPKSVNETNTLNFKVNASDVDGNNLTFSASGLPAGGTFNQSTRVFTWVPSKGQAGNYTVTFKVSDGYLNDSEEVKITIKKLNNPPVITSFEPANGSTFNKGGNVRIALNASDADNQALSYTIKLDGKIYSTSSSYVWETNYSSSGNHTIEMTVSDSIEEVKKINTVYINDYHPLWDVKEDGIVDILDVTSITRHYGEVYTNKPYPRWDVNKDGVINIQDLYLAGDHFDETVN